MALATGRPVQRAGARRTACSAPRPRRCVVRPRALALPDGPLFSPEQVLNGTYIGLGATAVSFLGTFLIIPQFKSSFKEDVDWRTMYADLVASGGVREVSAEEAGKKKGTLLDVRIASKYEAGHPVGALSAPLYLPIQGWGVPQVLRRAAFAFFGLAGTELNTGFVDDVAALVPKGREVTLVCETGGSLQNKAGVQFGFQSRSLKAAWYLRQAGYKVAVVKGGVALWSSAGLPFESGDGAEQELAARASRQQQRGGGTASSAPAAAKQAFTLFGRKE